MAPLFCAVRDAVAGRARSGWTDWFRVYFKVPFSIRPDYNIDAFGAVREMRLESAIRIFRFWHE
jgi:hypothetical protein